MIILVKNKHTLQIDEFKFRCCIGKKGSTIDKSTLDEESKNIQGGLSGKPLYDKSNKVLKEVSDLMDDSRTIIGVGGIDSAESAKEKFSLGADLLQIYTGLVYEGPNLLKKILES